MSNSAISTAIASLDQHVIGQDQAKRVLATAAHDHFAAIATLGQHGATSSGKPNVLFIGPPGCGMNVLVRALTAAMGVPHISMHADNLPASPLGSRTLPSQPAAYFVSPLGDSRAHNLQSGIIVIDGIQRVWHHPDARGLQQSITTLIDGTTISVLNRHEKTRQQTVEVDTTNFLFICIGTVLLPDGEEVADGIRAWQLDAVLASRLPRRAAAKLPTEQEAWRILQHYSRIERQ
jgi:ATP-dependent Clp protease ATP-binding subunit ClpX